jgi:hypothetical protein
LAFSASGWKSGEATSVRNSKVLSGHREQRSAPAPRLFDLRDTSLVIVEHDGVVGVDFRDELYCTFDPLDHDVEVPPNLFMSRMRAGVDSGPEPFFEARLELLQVGQHRNAIGFFTHDDGIVASSGAA